MASEKDEDERELPWFFKTKLRPQEPPVYWGLSPQDWADICQMEPKELGTDGK